VKKAVGIIYLGKISNTYSVEKVLKSIRYKSELIKDFKKINEYSHIIIPGVGSFQEGIKQLKKRQFDIVLKSKNLKPKVLAICLGMHILTKIGFEFKKTMGLNLFDGKVKRINFLKKIPHIGFSKIKFKKNFLFKNIKKSSEFYFMHSYYLSKVKDEYISSYINYKRNKLITSIKYKNFIGLQFHPEKSGKIGQVILNNFLKYK
jgi:glutamine amidotransferase